MRRNRFLLPNRRPTTSTTPAPQWTVRAVGQVQAVEDLRDTVVAVRGGTPVFLGDVADVVEGPAVRRGIARPDRTRGLEEIEADLRARLADVPGVGASITLLALPAVYSVAEGWFGAREEAVAPLLSVR